MRKHRYIKPVATKARRNYLVSEPNYHTTKNLSDNLLAIGVKNYNNNNNNNNNNNKKNKYILAKGPPQVTY